ncbi:MAG: tetratricopeptide repeat protein [Verrucomicrobia bacterium]|nr:tetratricopeptide repeat protein [Verrucomicrobiota bacterium]
MSSDSDKNNTVTRQSAWRIAFIALVLGLLTLGAYWGVWRNDSINYDDPNYVFENEHISKGLNWPAVVWSFTRTYVSNWHPLTWLSHALDCTLYGLKPAGHHVTSLILHIANTVLLWFALKLLTRSIWRSAFVAALFAIHPLHVESVAWVSERKDVLSGFFFMLTLIAYARYVNQSKDQSPQSKVRSPKSKVWYGLTLAALGCGLMSKAMLVTMPCVLLLLDVWPLNRTTRNTSPLPSPQSGEGDGWQVTGKVWKALVVEKIPFLILVVLSSVVTFIAQGEAVAAMDVIPLESRIGNAALAYVAYLGQTFWPANLALFYPHPMDIPTPVLAGSLMLLVVVSIVAVRQMRVRPYLAIGWFWFLGTLVPVIGLVQVGAQARADRYTYLPLIGIFIAVVWAVAEIADGRFRRSLLAGGSALLAALAVLTHQQVGHWRNSQTIFSHATHVTKENYVAWGCMGIDDLKQGRMDSAMTNLFRALEYASLRKSANSVKYYIGFGLQLQGKGLEALPYLEDSVVAFEMRPERSYRLGLSLSDAGRLPEAEAALREAIKARPSNGEFQLGMAVLLYQKGQVAEAEQMYREIAKNHPELAVAQSSFATFLTLLNRDAEAETNFAAAVKLKPEDAQTRRKFARTLDRLGKTREAISQFEEALKAKPNLTEMHFELAELLSKAGQTKLAAARYEKVIELDPKFLSALNNLAWILATDPDDKTRNGPRAIELAERACQLTEWKVAVLMGTLAAAYAEAGRFPDAVAMAEKARDTALAGKQEDVAKRNQELADLYRAEKPFREK